MAKKVAFAPQMAGRKYKPSTRSRVRAFFFTDRVGQTLATLLGMASIARWWTVKQLKQRLQATR
jgi:hypothetical protein